MPCLLSIFGDWNNFSSLPGSGIIILKREYDNTLQGPSCDLDEAPPGDRENKSKLVQTTDLGQVTAYPSPTSDQVNLSLQSNQSAEFKVYLINFALGQKELLLSGGIQQGTNEYQFSLNGRPSGAYLLLYELNGKPYSFKVLLH